MSSAAIRVEHLCKEYRIGARQQQYSTLRDTISEVVTTPFRAIGSMFRSSNGRRRKGDETIWALRNLSFEVNRGEVIGVIGRNGAGKSTLLKILSRVTEPTEGRAEIRGRVGSLLEVGTGFHPELTGRENIYLNGAILGMKRGEIERKFEDIVAFAEVDKFIDTPVKHYSSGMYLRLAFAVAAHLEPKILVVDEVLAVGDAAFQKKCLGKMADVAQGGRTVMFVSHNMGAVLALCTRVLVLAHGCVTWDGRPEEGIASYLGSLNSCSQVSLADRRDREGNQHLTFTDLRILNSSNQAVNTICAGEDLTFELTFRVSGESVKYAQFQMNFLDSLGQILFTCFTKTVDQAFPEVKQGSKVLCRVPSFPLAPGTYGLNVTCYEHKVVADRILGAAQFTVTDGNFFGNGRSTPPDCGRLMVKNTWELAKDDGDFLSHSAALASLRGDSPHEFA